MIKLSHFVGKCDQKYGGTCKKDRYVLWVHNVAYILPLNSTIWLELLPHKTIQCIS